MSLDRYDKKFQKYLLGEALKGNTVLMSDFEEGVLLSDTRMIKIIDKKDCYIKVPKSVALDSLIYAFKGVILSDNYTYTKVKGIKDLCLKINDNYSVESKYLQFFDLDKSDLYFDASGVLYIKEDDLISGCILCIKGGQSDE